MSQSLSQIALRPAGPITVRAADVNGRAVRIERPGAKPPFVKPISAPATLAAIITPGAMRLSAAVGKPVVRSADADTRA